MQRIFAYSLGLTKALRAKFCIFLGIVAENSSVCLCCLKYEKIVRMSSSKPMSIIRSASSKHKYLNKQQNKQQNFNYNVLKNGLFSQVKWYMRGYVCAHTYIHTHTLMYAQACVFVNALCVRIYNYTYLDTVHIHNACTHASTMVIH